MWNLFVCFRLPVKACRPQSELIPWSFYLRFKDCCESQTEQGNLVFSKEQILLNTSSFFGRFSRNIFKKISSFSQNSIIFEQIAWPNRSVHQGVQFSTVRMHISLVSALKIFCLKMGRSMGPPLGRGGGKIFAPPPNANPICFKFKCHVFFRPTDEVSRPYAVGRVRIRTGRNISLGVELRRGDRE